MMGGGEMGSAHPARRVEQQRISRPSRGRLDAGRRRGTVPAHRAESETVAPGDLADEAGFGRRFGPEAMIDVQDEQIGAGRQAGAPATGEDQKGERIGAAGDCEGQPLRAGERREPCQERRVASRRQRISSWHWPVLA